MLAEWKPFLLAYLAVLLLLAASFFPGGKEFLFGEGKPIETMQFLSFLGAGFLWILAGARQKRATFLLVGFFALFLAGEEINWGVYYFFPGYSPPVVVSEHIDAVHDLGFYGFAPLAEIFGAAQADLFLFLAAGLAFFLFRARLNALWKSLPQTRDRALLLVLGFLSLAFLADLGRHMRIEETLELLAAVSLLVAAIETNKGLTRG